MQSTIKGLANCLPKADQDFIDYMLHKEVESGERREIINDYLESEPPEKINNVLWMVKDEKLQMEIIRSLLEVHEGYKDLRRKALVDTLNIEDESLSRKQKRAIRDVLLER